MPLPALNAAAESGISTQAFLATGPDWPIEAPGAGALEKLRVDSVQLVAVPDTFKPVDWLLVV